MCDNVIPSKGKIYSRFIGYSLLIIYSEILLENLKMFPSEHETGHSLPSNFNVTVSLFYFALFKLWESIRALTSYILIIPSRFSGIRVEVYFPESLVYIISFILVASFILKRMIPCFYPSRIG